MTRYFRVGTEFVVWSGLCFGVWLLTLSSVTSQDVLVAALAAVLAAGCAVGGRKVAGGRWHPRIAWLRWYLGLPVAIVLDTARILALVYSTRRRLGETSTVQLPADDPEDVAAARYALGSLALSASPGAYVADIDTDERTMTVHSPGSSTPRWAQVDPSED